MLPHGRRLLSGFIVILLSSMVESRRRWHETVIVGIVLQITTTVSAGTGSGFKSPLGHASRRQRSNIRHSFSPSRRMQPKAITPHCRCVSLPPSFIIVLQSWPRTFVLLLRIPGVVTVGKHSRRQRRWRARRLKRLFRTAILNGRLPSRQSPRHSPDWRLCCWLIFFLVLLLLLFLLCATTATQKGAKGRC